LSPNIGIGFTIEIGVSVEGISSGDNSSATGFSSNIF
jgi:hypothetical protein